MKCSMDYNKFRNILNLLSICNDEECRLNISKKGWNIELVDPANVCMICVEMPNTAFNSYKCTKSEEIGFDYSIMFKPKVKMLNKIKRFGNIVNVEIKDNIKIDQFCPKDIEGLDNTGMPAPLPGPPADLYNVFIIDFNDSDGGIKGNGSAQTKEKVETYQIKAI